MGEGTSAHRSQTGVKRIHGDNPVTTSESWTRTHPYSSLSPLSLPPLRQQKPVTVMFLVYHKHTYQTHLLPAGDTNNCTNIYTVKSLGCEERDQHQGDTQGIGAGWLGLHRGNCERRGVPGGGHASTPEELKELADGARGRKTVTSRGRRAVPPVGSAKGRTAPGHRATRPEARPRSPGLQWWAEN